MGQQGDSQTAMRALGARGAHVRSSTTIFPTRVVVPHTQIASVLYTPSGRDEKPRVAEASRLNISACAIEGRQSVFVSCVRWFVSRLDDFPEGSAACFSVLVVVRVVLIRRDDAVRLAGCEGSVSLAWRTGEG